MSITDQLTLPPGADTDAVLAYLRAQEAKSFQGHDAFLHPDVFFNGLVLNARGANKIAEEMDRFLPAISHLSVDAAVRVEEGKRSRYLVLYQFQLQGQAAPQPLCDHIQVEDGKLIQIDNAFDLTKLPQLG